MTRSSGQRRRGGGGAIFNVSGEGGGAWADVVLRCGEQTNERMNGLVE